MLDVHPPEHAVHSWRDFFIHIATIVVGLIIAVGLEQTVEWFHHRHQRHELLEGINVDARKSIADSENVHRSCVSKLVWLDARIAQVQQSLKTKQPLPASSHPATPDWDEPINPTWKAALNSQLVHVLSQEEIQAFSESNDVLDTLQSLHWPMNNADQRIEVVEAKYGFRGTAAVQATPEQLEQYLEALVDARFKVANFDAWAEGAHGAETAILQGERDVDMVQKAERNKW
ncbi:MAG: hypothetical protein PW792_07915 [Acidobacteriaceae bacterium]|nr:hypothetical protein [Acidobacteriaceae bacterium]